MGNPEFLKQKYPDLNTSPEVRSAARRTEFSTDEELPPQQPDSRIQNYLDRLATFLKPELAGEAPANEQEKKQIRHWERRMEFLKESLHKQFVIKPEQVPESYFDSIKRKHHEEGHGDIEIPGEYRRELAETIVEDQRKSLDRWLDYLVTDDAKYPDYLKYYAIRSVLRMGRFDKQKKSFTERTGGTIAPFPDCNRDALAIVLEAFELQAEGKQPKFGYDIDEGTKKQFLQFLQQKNFAKLYALAVEEFKPIAEELLKITEGEWRSYPADSDPALLVQAIAPYGTGWCLRGEAMSRRYLVRDKNSIQIFFSNNTDGNPDVPRVVIVTNAAGQTAEVRGVAPEENLDKYIGPVVEKKLAELPDGKAYTKKSEDMKFLTRIEKKTKNRENLTSAELTFLYEINAPIEGFGYSQDGKCSDPRVAQLRKERNPMEDMLVIFECDRSQIANVPSQINARTKAYIGQLEPGIFQKLPANFEHIYTSFPERKIRKESLLIGGRNAKQLEQDLLANDYKIYEYALDMLRSKDFTTLKKPEAVDLVRLTAKDLGFDQGATTDQIYQRAKELGLELCPAEVGPQYRLAYKDQPMGDWFVVAMKPIADRDDYPDVFGVGRSDDGLWLYYSWADPAYHWNSDRSFVFRLRQPEAGKQVLES